MLIHTAEEKDTRRKLTAAMVAQKSTRKLKHSETDVKKQRKRTERADALSREHIISGDSVQVLNSEKSLHDTPVYYSARHIPALGDSLVFAPFQTGARAAPAPDFFSLLAFVG